MPLTEFPSYVSKISYILEFPKIASSVTGWGSVEYYLLYDGLN